jgi:hypothetical protein
VHQLERAAAHALLERVAEQTRRRFAGEPDRAVAVQHGDGIGAVLDQNAKQRIHSARFHGLLHQVGVE